MLLALLLPLFAGCEMETRVVRSSWDQWRQLAWADQPAPDRSTDGRAATSRGRGYTIELGRFSGPTAYNEAFDLVNTVRQQAGVANLWYTSVGSDTVVYAGRFRDRNSAEARNTLDQVRRVSIDGERPFSSVKFVALSGTEVGEALDPNDLRTLTGSGKYALQIGFYDARFGENFRKAAETAAEILREQGEEAYYYHGPNRSMVLIGAWTYGQAFQRDGVVDRYSSVVREAQREHPHNIPNGQPFGDNDDSEYVKSQSSFLVPVP